LAVLGALSLSCSPAVSQTADGQAAEGKPAKTASAKTKANKTKKAAKPKKAVRPATKAAVAAGAAGAAGAAVAALVGTGPAYAERAEAMEFADELARQHQLPRESLRQTLGRARQSPQVITLMQPATAPFVKNWRVYRSRFLDSWRIQAGLAFWQQHHKELARAESVYGVPAEIIVGVLGVETIYGREMGRFRVIDALSTLAFDFPAAHPRAAERSDYFRKELAQFLLAQNRLGLDPFKALGSYAGASGMPQFMPSSIASFAVDFDGDGRIDLRGSVSDAIGSVAR
jgi:membrane-bound lytic murein transglycosylase B